MHDLSYNRKEDLLVNQRVRKMEMPGVIFGFALLRFLTLLHHTRWSFPNEPIFCHSINVEKAYRRLQHLSHHRSKVHCNLVPWWYVEKNLPKIQ